MGVRRAVFKGGKKCIVLVAQKLEKEEITNEEVGVGI